jgi:hypothetical protein
MEPSSAQYSAGRALASAGIGTTALVVALAAAAPAWAIANDGQGSRDGDSSRSQAAQGQPAQGQPAQSQPAQHADSDGHNPPGNNGTVFIHDVAGDHTPHNVPHVGCTFYVDFFGFDHGQSVTMTFAGQAPTGKGTALAFSPSTVDVGGDDAGGAGNDWDAEVPVTLDTSVLGAPQPQQGYHVKLTVSTGQPSNANAGQVKHKVFWIAPCNSATPVASDTGTTTQTGGTSGGSTGGAEVMGTTLHRATSTAVVPTRQIPTQVLGLTIHRSPRATTRVLRRATPRSLPFTGAEIGGLIAAAAAAIGGGALLTVAGRRRRRANQ